MEGMELLSMNESPFGMRAALALQEKGLQYEFINENLLDKSELLLKSNPIHKKIPVLLHNSKPILESLIILEYLDETWPATKSLLPKDPYEKSQARFWGDFIDKKFVQEGTAKLVGKKGEEQEEGKKKMLECLGIMEGVLGDQDYFGGDVFGYVDIALLPFTAWFKGYETIGKWEIPLETDFPKLKSWIKRCHERESVKDIIASPDQVVKAVKFVRKLLLGEEYEE